MLLLNVLSRVSMGSMAQVESGNKKLVKELHYLACLGIRLNSLSNGGVLVPNGVESSLREEVKIKQDMDPTFVELKKLVVDKKVDVFLDKGEMECCTTDESNGLSLGLLYKEL